jgi:S1-C subfamily serine protease
MARRARVDAGTKGAVVTDVATDSPGGVAGIEPGDVIAEVSRQPVNSAADYNRIARGLKKGEAALVRVRRGQLVQYVTVKLPK